MEKDKECPLYNSEKGICKMSDAFCKTGVWEKENCTHVGDLLDNPLQRKIDEIHSSINFSGVMDGKRPPILYLLNELIDKQKG